MSIYQECTVYKINLVIFWFIVYHMLNGDLLTFLLRFITLRIRNFQLTDTVLRILWLYFDSPMMCPISAHGVGYFLY